jgi:chemotaxis protein MotA
MFFLVGIISVITSVLLGFFFAGGKMMILFQPAEILIICGSAFGAYLIANPKSVIVNTIKEMKVIIVGSRYVKKDYVELLSLMFCLLKIARSKGILSLEQHIENPAQSPIFQKYNSILKSKHDMNFLVDTLRMMIVGVDQVYHLEDMMNSEIDAIEYKHMSVCNAMQNTGDSLPALGIVAAVLGVINTMGAITEPPEVLGHHIGSALVGTFMGVLLSYGIVSPMAQSIKNTVDMDVKYYHCIKFIILGYANGYAPSISVDLGRRILLENFKPSFQELEDLLKESSIDA